MRPYINILTQITFQGLYLWKLPECKRCCPCGLTRYVGVLLRQICQVDSAKGAVETHSTRCCFLRDIQRRFVEVPNNQRSGALYMTQPKNSYHPLSPRTNHTLGSAILWLRIRSSITQPMPCDVVVVLVGPVHAALATEEREATPLGVEDHGVIGAEEQQVVADVHEAAVLSRKAAKSRVEAEQAPVYKANPRNIHRHARLSSMNIEFQKALGPL